MFGPEDEEQFSADPGHVGGFGVLVDGVGRGLARAVACGKEFTLVATYPYEGPVMDVRYNASSGVRCSDGCMYHVGTSK